jgi:carbonic anhydrase
MKPMTATDVLLKRYHDAEETLPGDRSSPRPSLQITVLTCMDARMIVQHTNCGLSLVTEDDFKDELESATGLRPTWAVEAFREVSDSVRRSMQRVKRSDFLLHNDHVRGFVYDVKTGELTEVL